MPIGRYIAWVGASLLVLLFAANWFLPQSLAEPTGGEVSRPVIRIGTDYYQHQSSNDNSAVSVGRNTRRAAPASATMRVSNFSYDGYCR
jgi:hypothetical protein